MEKTTKTAYFFAPRPRSFCTVLPIVKLTTMSTRTLREQQQHFFLLNYFIKYTQNDESTRRTPLIYPSQPPTQWRPLCPHCVPSQRCRAPAVNLMLLTATVLVFSVTHHVSTTVTTHRQELVATLSPACSPWRPPWPPPWGAAIVSSYPAIVFNKLHHNGPSYDRASARKHKLLLYNARLSSRVPDRYCPWEKISQMPRLPTPQCIVHLCRCWDVLAPLPCHPLSKEDTLQLFKRRRQCTGQVNFASASTWLTSSRASVAILCPPVPPILLQNTSSLLPPSYPPQVPSAKTMTARPSRKSPSSLLAATKASSARTRSSSRLALAKSRDEVPTVAEEDISVLAERITNPSDTSAEATACAEANAQTGALFPIRERVRPTLFSILLFSTSST